MFKYRFNIEQLAPAHHHGEADPLAEPRVGDPEGRRLLDRRVAEREGFDVRGMDVIAAADDHILLAAGDAQIALAVEPAEIAGHEPARGVERRLGRHLVVEIAEHQAGAAAADLADLAWRGDRKSTRLNSSHANISYAVFCLYQKRTRLNFSHANISYDVLTFDHKRP